MTLSGLVPWHVDSAEDALATPWFVIRRYTGRTGGDDTRFEYYVHEAADSVLCVCMTAEGFVILQRQYRLPLRRVSLDFPGGAIEHDDASPEAAAIREFREETGIVATAPRLLAALDKDPGFSRGKVYIYLLTEAPGTDGAGPPEEQIEHVFLRPAEVLEAVDDGRVSCCFCVAAALKTARYLGW